MITEPHLRLTVPLPLGVYARRPVPKLPFPLGAPECSLFALARHGLWAGVQAIGLKEGDEVLVPAYHHGSEIEALQQAKLTCRFYDATETLEPDHEELESLLGPRTRALYVIHYFGFPRQSARWRAWCDERGLLLLEDAAQAWLSSVDGRPVGAVGDLAIFCLYKTVGLPDGAALVSRSVPANAGDDQRLGFAGVVSLHTRWLAGRSRWFAAVDEGLWRARRTLEDRSAAGRNESEAEPNSIFALGNPASAPSQACLFLLPRLADIDAAARRRLNYEVLLEAFRDRAPPPFSTVPEGASPLVFPLEAEIDGDVADRLAQRGIDARPFWPVLHPSVPHAAFPGAAAWRRRFLALPVHQELRFEDLQRVIAAVNGRRRRSEMRLEPLDDFASVREEWNSLAEASGNVFATWEWASIWWRHFGDGHRQLAAACRDPKGTLIAILPLYVSSARSLRIVRFVGDGPADQLGPVCAPHDRGRAAAALRMLLSTSRGWDVFVGEQLPGDEGWSALLGARRIDRSGSPVIRFETEDWDGFLSTLSSRFRHEIRSDERKLRREHDLRFRLAGDAASLDEDLEKLFALHAGRWPGSAFGTRHRAFHREFAHSAFGRGWLRLWFLEIDGDPVAAWYGFRFAGVESHYQGGRDPAWARSSVGLVVLAHSIREALADGMREYRFLRGAEQHKYRFTKLDPGLETVALGRGVAGRAALATYTAARNARDLARASAAAFRNAGPPRR